MHSEVSSRPSRDAEMSVHEDCWPYDSQEKLDEAIADAKSYWISQGNNPQAYTDEQARRPSKEPESRKMAGAYFHSLLTANLRAIFRRSASKSRMHVGTPPTGELGALSHLDSFISFVFLTVP